MTKKVVTGDPALVKNTDTKIASLVVFLYFVLVIVLLPPDEHFRAIGTGLLYFGAITAIGWRMGRGPLNGMTLLIVSFAGIGLLAFATFPAIGGAHARFATTLGFFGSQAGALLWAALRWRELPHKHIHVSLQESLKTGAFMAAGISGIATIPVIIAFLIADPRAVTLLLIYPSYFAGFLTAAIFYWLLQGVDHLAVGRYAIGLLGGFCLYAAVGPVVSLLDRQPMDPTEMVTTGLICGMLVGPVVALGLDDEEKRMRNRKKL